MTLDTKNKQKKGIMDTKWSGHFIWTLANDYSWEHILMAPHDWPAEEREPVKITEQPVFLFSYPPLSTQVNYSELKQRFKVIEEDTEWLEMEKMFFSCSFWPSHSSKIVLVHMSASTINCNYVKWTTHTSCANNRRFFKWCRRGIWRRLIGLQVIGQRSHAHVGTVFP